MTTILETIPLSYLELRSVLYDRLRSRGIKDVFISWNDVYLRKIDLMIEGPDKEAAIDEAADKFAKMFKDVEEGHYISITLGVGSIEKPEIHKVKLNKICSPFPGMHKPWSEEKKAELKAIIDMNTPKVKICL